MKKFLSIGDLSKMKGVSIRSLRYYDKIGVLKPAYVDPESGYRYYTMNQAIMLELISLCISMDIPLKNFDKYENEEGIFNAKQVILDGKLALEKKKKEIEQSEFKIKQIEEFLDNSNSLEGNKKETVKEISRKYFITREMDIAIDGITSSKQERKFISEITKLYKVAESSSLYASPNSGVMLKKNNGRWSVLVYLEVNKKVENTNSLTIPKCRVTSYVTDISELENLIEDIVLGEDHDNGKIFMIRELISENFQGDRNQFELQEISIKIGLSQK